MINQPYLIACTELKDLARDLLEKGHQELIQEGAAKAAYYRKASVILFDLAYKLEAKAVKV